MDRVRVMFLGNSSSEFSNRLFEALTATEADVVAVVDSPGDRAAATTHGTMRVVPGAVGSPDFVSYAGACQIPSYCPSNVNSPQFVSTLSERMPDGILAAGYMSILKEDLLRIPRIAAINFHASLLPKYRGMHPVFWALRNNEGYSGITVHHMSSILDEGDIIFQNAVRILPTDTVSSLYGRIIEESVPLVERVVLGLKERGLPRRPQPREGASYYSEIKPEDYRVDWSMDALRIEAMVRTTPGKCFCCIAGKRVYLHKVEMVDKGIQDSRVAQIVSLSADKAVVGTGRGELAVMAVDWGQGAGAFADFCRRENIGEGDVLQDARF